MAEHLRKPDSLEIRLQVPDGLALAEEQALRFDLLAQREEILHHLGNRKDQETILDEMRTMAQSFSTSKRAVVARLRGRWHLALNRWDDAEADLRRALELDAGTNPGVLMLLAKSLSHQQRREEAEST